MGITVGSLLADNYGCGHLRTIWPSEALNKYSDEIEPTILTEFTHAEDYDIVVAHRQCTNPQLAFFEHLKERRHKTLIYQIDDNMFNIDPANKVAYEWYTDELKQNAVRIMNMCDRVVVNNEHMIQVLIEQGVESYKIVKILNHFPEDWKIKPQEKFHNYKPVILCAFTQSYAQELHWLFPLILRTKNKWNWKISGMNMRGEIIEEHPEVDFLDFFHPRKFVSELQKLNPDIGLCPKLDTVFNKSRGTTKGLTYSLLGIPAIGSKNKGWSEPAITTNVENDLDLWEAKIEELLNDKWLYDTTVQHQKSYLKDRWLDERYTEWEDLFKSVI